MIKKQSDQAIFIQLVQVTYLNLDNEGCHATAWSYPDSGKELILWSNFVHIRTHIYSLINTSSAMQSFLIFQKFSITSHRESLL